MQAHCCFHHSIDILNFNTWRLSSRSSKKGDFHEGLQKRCQPGSKDLLSCQRERVIFCSCFHGEGVSGLHHFLVDGGYLYPLLIREVLLCFAE